jgi:hypothetical protein
VLLDVPMYRYMNDNDEYINYQWENRHDNMECHNRATLLPSLTEVDSRMFHHEYHDDEQKSSSTDEPIYSYIINKQEYQHSDALHERDDAQESNLMSVYNEMIKNIYNELLLLIVSDDIRSMSAGSSSFLSPLYHPSTPTVLSVHA